MIFKLLLISLYAELTDSQSSYDEFALSSEEATTVEPWTADISMDYSQSEIITETETPYIPGFDMTCYHGVDVCISGYISLGRAHFRVDVSAAYGYSAIGFGGSMNDADIMVFRDFNNTFYVESRKVVDAYSTPVAFPNDDIQDVSVGYKNNRFYVAFSRSAHGINGFTNNLFVGLNDIVWAIGDLKEDGDLYKHTYRGAYSQGLNITLVGEEFATSEYFESTTFETSTLEKLTATLDVTKLTTTDMGTLKLT
eukprot:NODE_323_length_10965_cov_0.441561.p5 type:complete len:253 gc:universal NODE_323_length_10965_cov_0.441561:7233-6475(-)